MDDEWLRSVDNHILSRGGPNFPELLERIPRPPDRLYVKGDPDLLHMPALAIVGSRNPTEAGRRTAYEFARHLGAAGFCIVSGLAEGIDTAAHRGALDAGAATVAFLGHGIDRVYPSSNLDLAHEIAANGALATEFPLGTHPDKSHFPQRNRLISGMSLGTLVVEAARRSGSLITARLAGEQGREVFAVPGSIHNPLARGCHKLIRQGAKLVETAEDIVAEIAPLCTHLLQTSLESTTKEELPEHDDEEYRHLRKHLGHDPVSVDELAENSGLTIDQVSSMLLILELEGIVESQSGGRYSLLAR
ncbi:MAG: DNA-protecting protein DprA [Woeseiaceae bacterium]|nr:DNA-protecting protein DprA [Woeseiaceae bacterium]NIP20572.1 DNA-protecting protein DprA [Woeseiaceae bacterium]NIS89365.1 DNA-protecting protein DprA [Woeseiaceae bacterium]